MEEWVFLTSEFMRGTALRQSRYMASMDFSPRICLTVAGFIMMKLKI